MKYLIPFLVTISMFLSTSNVFSNITIKQPFELKKCEVMTEERNILKLNISSESLISGELRINLTIPEKIKNFKNNRNIQNTILKGKINQHQIINQIFIFDIPDDGYYEFNVEFFLSFEENMFRDIVNSCGSKSVSILINYAANFNNS